jgi:cation diffusion facilitator CzcD-associated flavoprotein CzcO
MSAPKTIVVGAGIAGIAMGHTLKWKLGYSNFEVCNNCFASYKY